MTDPLSYWLYFISLPIQKVEEQADQHTQTAFLPTTSIVQCYTSSRTQPLLRLIYRFSPETNTTALAARCFGTWNLLSTVVRIYGGIFIHEQAAFDLALLTFVIALAHFLWEWGVAKTVGGLPLLVMEVTPIVSII